MRKGATLLGSQRARIEGLMASRIPSGKAPSLNPTRHHWITILAAVAFLALVSHGTHSFVQLWRLRTTSTAAQSSAIVGHGLTSSSQSRVPKVASRAAGPPKAPGGPPLPSFPLGIRRPSEKKGLVEVELFLDLCCPFSKRMFETLNGGIVQKYEGKVDFIVHSVAQPWHAQSSYMHEASLAVFELAGPAKFWEYVTAVFANQEAFFDDAVFDKTRKEVYQSLADLAVGAGVEPAKVMQRLELTGTGNAGSAVTQRFKWATKLHRVRGVHVTPTVFLNGLEAGIVGSGWTPAEWSDFLDYHHEMALDQA